MVIDRPSVDAGFPTDMKNNSDIVCFYLTKHSWKGKFRRVFSVGTLGISTYNPASMEFTNQWVYANFLTIVPTLKSTVANEFCITVRRGRKVESMRFSSEHRAAIITEVLRQQSKFGQLAEPDFSCAARKLPYTGAHSPQHQDRSRSDRPLTLEATSCCLRQLNQQGHQLSVYDYKDIESVAPLSEPADGLVIVMAPFGRRHLFSVLSASSRDQLLRTISDRALRCVGVSVPISCDEVSLVQSQQQRLGAYSDDFHLTSLTEFDVYKLSARHGANGSRGVSRLLCLTESCLVERRPDTYQVCSLRPLTSIHALVRAAVSEVDIQVEYVCGAVRHYTSSERDSLLASLLDCARAAGNMAIHVRCCGGLRGRRLGPLACPVDEDVESMHLRFLQQPPTHWSSEESVMRFNANVPYSGLMHAVSGESLFAENKEKLINVSLAALIAKAGDQRCLNVEQVEAQFHALRRLLASKSGFAVFTQMPGFREQLGVKVVSALRRDSVCVTHAAIDMLATLMQPMHTEPDLRQEQLNKTSILSSNTFLVQLLDAWSDYVNRRTGALVVSSFLDFLTYSLSAPYSETTDSHQFDTLLQMVADRAATFYALFNHRSPAIVKGAGLVVRALIEEGSVQTAQHMQRLALTQCALLFHLHSALFTRSQQGGRLAHRQLSRYLVAMWTGGCSDAWLLLRRVLPIGLLTFLDSDRAIPLNADDGSRHLFVRDNVTLIEREKRAIASGPASVRHLRSLEQQLHTAGKFVERHIVELAPLHWRQSLINSQRAREQRERDRERPVTLRKRRRRSDTDKSAQNWPLFYHEFDRDHIEPHLIWNGKTREELREALETELRSFVSDRQLAGDSLISWNHTEFEVPYRCLQTEIRVGDYFLRVLLEQDETNQLSDSPLRDPCQFFSALYHRFLLTSTIEMRCMCLQAMALVYGRHGNTIGLFADCSHLVAMLINTRNLAERDRLVLFLDRLATNCDNVKLMMDTGVVRCLCDLLSVAHLHASRTRLPQQRLGNVIEHAGDGDGTDSSGGAGGLGAAVEKEWYYKDDNKERHGPLTLNDFTELFKNGAISESTLCWAQGLDGWCRFDSVPQLKWTLLAVGKHVLDPTELAVRILDVLIRMCEYYPSREADGALIRPISRLKRLLSSYSCLPHVVQLLLTFDPVIVERVACLLTELMRDHPSAPQLYFTGVYYFILMYTGSNVLPIARFLQLTHTCQSQRRDPVYETSEQCRDSVLAHLLPEAMICYLSNYGAERFAEIFLGEFDTPEVIWGSEMRQQLILKVSCHLADYSPRLKSNTRAVYQFCPMPIVVYSQLERELFCGRYYLRHLCDTARFPDWPIAEPVTLLREVLAAWKHEVAKQPSSMSVQQALSELDLETTVTDQSAMRKAYFRLAQRYHPDKNPDGREKFEAVNRAYEFLCARSNNHVDGPDPNNIYLVLKTQSILFDRFCERLHAYKYAGYPMLVTTITMETEDEQLFNKPVHILAAATEVAHHSVRCSALNAEELRREEGLTLLQSALTRCCSVLSKLSTADDLAVIVCVNVCRCFSVAAQFESCRDCLIQLSSQLAADLCRVIYYKRLPTLCAAGVECVSALGVDSRLQMALLGAGVLWHLLLFVFYYDYTLEEGGVERSAAANQQEMANRLACQSVHALARLAGCLSGAEASPANPAGTAALNAMLTPRGVYLLSQQRSAELLKLLNVNTENPHVVWNDSMRTELKAFLREQQASHVRSGASDPSLGADFRFTALADELYIGNVYVRVYNQMPAFQLDSVKQFVIELLYYLSESVSGGDGVTAEGCPNSTSVNVSNPGHVTMCLHALANAVQNNTGVELQCIGHASTFCSLLQWQSLAVWSTSGREHAVSIANACTRLLSCISACSDCAIDLSVGGWLILELMLLLMSAVCENSGERSIQQLQESVPCVLTSMTALLTQTTAVKHCLSSGVLLLLLDLFCTSGDHQLRQGCAELLARALADRLVGPEVRLLLLRFLPALIVDVMCSDSGDAVQMFDTVQENPELVWNDECRRAVAVRTAALRHRFVADQRLRRQLSWQPPEQFVNEQLEAGDSMDQLVVAGVYVRLYVSNPGWPLRRPLEFGSRIVDRLLDTAASVCNSPIANQSTSKSDASSCTAATLGHVQLLAAGTVTLLKSAPAAVAPLAPAHSAALWRALAAVPASSPSIAQALSTVLLQWSGSEAFVRAVVQSTATISPMAALATALNTHNSLTELLADTLCRLMDGDRQRVTQMALSARLVSLLLELLDCDSDTVSATGKAYIVRALKSMQACDVPVGPEVSALLDESLTWQRYSRQRHDLFLTARSTGVAGSGGAPLLAGVPAAGYLMAPESAPEALIVPPS